MTYTDNIYEAQHFFFIGVAGSGMSAIAQYLAGVGKQVSGSDRLFGAADGQKLRKQLESKNIACFAQDGSGIDSTVDVVVISTAVEPQNAEYQKAEQMGKTIVHRSAMLKAITDTRTTIAVAGTSGKSTTVAMLFHILDDIGFSPSIISGAGLTQLSSNGDIGNAAVGSSEWLIIEADESDGTLVNYTPAIGLLLNIDKDHKELHELMQIFGAFAQNTKKQLIVNRDCVRARTFSTEILYDFGVREQAGIHGENFSQTDSGITFEVRGVQFSLPVIGHHNYENALAAIATAYYIGVCITDSALSMKTFAGLSRRMNIVGKKNGVLVIDDYAHNPVKVAAAIRACHGLGQRVVAWFQPHGFGPTRFLRNEFIDNIAEALAENDQIIMSEIYYAGGTVVRDISANDLVEGIVRKGKNAVFIENRADFALQISAICQAGDVLLLMGARDNSLADFALQVFESIQSLSIKIADHNY